MKSSTVRSWNVGGPLIGPPDATPGRASARVSAASAAMSNDRCIRTPIRTCVDGSGARPACLAVRSTARLGGDQVRGRMRRRRPDALLLSPEAVGKLREDRVMRRSDKRRGGGRFAPARRRAGAFLGGGGGDQVAVELEEIVGGGDEPPFRPAGGSA